MKKKVTATVVNEFNQWGATVILNCRCNGPEGDRTYAFKGRRDETGEPKSGRGLTYHFFGDWGQYTNPRTQETSTQFYFSNFAKAMPYTEDGIRRYLNEAPGIGLRSIDKMLDAYGVGLVDAIKKAPAVVADKTGLPLKKVELLREWMLEQSSLEGITLDLNSLLGKLGIQRTVYKQLIERYGEKAAGVVRNNPYILTTCKGCGFATADKLYMSLGYDPTALVRQTAMLEWLVASDRNGHTWLDSKEMEKQLFRQFGDESRFQDAVDQGVRFQRLSVSGNLITLRGMEEDETALAEAIGEMLS